MLGHALAFALLLLLQGHRGQEAPEPSQPVAALSGARLVLGPPSTQPGAHSAEWKVRPRAGPGPDMHLLLTWRNGSGWTYENCTRDGVSDRLHVVAENFTLLIEAARRRDSGLYVLEVTHESGAVCRHGFSVSVFDPVAQPRLQEQWRRLDGGTCHVTLSCVVPAGDALSYAWSRGSERIPTARNLTRLELRGPRGGPHDYTCNVSNAVSWAEGSLRLSPGCPGAGRRPGVLPAVLIPTLLAATLPLGALACFCVHRRRRRRPEPSPEDVLTVYEVINSSRAGGTQVRRPAAPPSRAGKRPGRGPWWPGGHAGPTVAPSPCCAPVGSGGGAAGRRPGTRPAFGVSWLTSLGTRHSGPGRTGRQRGRRSRAGGPLLHPGLRLPRAAGSLRAWAGRPPRLLGWGGGWETASGCRRPDLGGRAECGGHQRDLPSHRAARGRAPGHDHFPPSRLLAPDADGFPASGSVVSVSPPWGDRGRPPSQAPGAPLFVHPPHVTRVCGAVCLGPVALPSAGQDPGRGRPRGPQGTPVRGHLPPPPQAHAWNGRGTPPGSCAPGTAPAAGGWGGPPPCGSAGSSQGRARPHTWRRRPTAPEAGRDPCPLVPAPFCARFQGGTALRCPLVSAWRDHGHSALVVAVFTRESYGATP